MNSIIKYKARISASLNLASLVAIVLGSSTAVGQTPVAHWTFDEGIANYDLTTIEDVANDNDAVWQDLDAEMNFDTSGLSYTAGRIGAAVRLGGGTNQFFQVDAIPQIDGIVATPPIGEGDPVLGVGLTLSAWIYIPESVNSGNKGILVSRTVTDEALSGQGTNQNWGMNWEGGDHIDSRVSAQAVDSSAVIMKEQWHHVTMVWGNVDDQAAFILPAQRVYVDGVLEGEDTDTEVFELVSSGSWLIGEDSCCGGREFEGLIDDVAIFASALSTAEVQTLYNNGLNGINASGIPTDDILAGDVDGGGVSIADFNIIRDNLGKTVGARSLGDLDGNRKVDLDDFQQWLDAAPAPLAAEALASFTATVPEPSSLVLVAFAAAAACLGWRRVQLSPARSRR